MAEWERAKVDHSKFDEGESVLELKVSEKEEVQEQKQEKEQESKQTVKADGEYEADEQHLEIYDLAARYDTHLDQQNPKKSKGLSQAEAEKRLARDGPNRLTPPKQTPEIIKFLRQFVTGFMILLEVAAILCFIAYGISPEDAVNLYLAIILIVIVVGTSTMSYLQERQSSKLMAGFQGLLPQSCRVIRDGQDQRTNVENLVLGDVIVVNSGDKVPADMRIIECDNFKVDNSSLTGESEPQSRNAKVSKEIPMEAKNLAFYGTLALDGSAYGVVIRVGDNTLIGQIASLTGSEKKPTSLEIEVKKFVRLISVVAILMGIIFFAIDIAITPEQVVTVLVNTIGVIISNIPEGLPATVTVCLTIAAKKLASKYVWVKKLESVETLGSTTLVASDKTGTLTQNKMTAVHAWYDNKVYETRETNVIQEEPSELINKDSPSCSSLLRVAAICSRAEFENSDDPDTVALDISERPIIGDASETALLRLCETYLDTMTMRDEYPKVFEIPFNSANKFQISIHIRPMDEQSAETKSIDRRKTLLEKNNAIDRTKSAVAIQRTTSFFQRTVSAFRLRSQTHKVYSPLKNVDEAIEMEKKRTDTILSRYNKQRERIQTNAVQNKNTSSRLLVIKGAPEVVLRRCSHFMADGKEYPITDQWRETFQQTILKLASNGERILGFAHYSFEDSTDPREYNVELNNYPTEGYHFVGLISLMDPPREAVPGAIRSAHKAGIKVVMVTGDHPLTAKAIAKQIGLLTLPTVEDIAKERNIPVDQVPEEDVHAVVVNGQTISTFGEEEWQKTIVKKQLVFARTSPQQKLQIVQHFQGIKEVVAVTGDGVNDSPALKAANIGVAMGVVGSDVAKETADVILMNDDFSAIIDGVEGGRVIFDNLKKTIEYTLSHTVPEVAPFLLSVIIGLPLGLSPQLLLCIDLGTELAPAMSLAYEHPEADIMDRPPRDSSKDHLVSVRSLAYAYLQIGLITFASCFVSYMHVFMSHGIPLSELYDKAHDYFQSGAKDLTIDGKTFTDNDQMDILQQAQAAWFWSLVICQMGNLLACKTKKASVFTHGFRNHIANIALVIEFAILCAIVFIPPLNIVFSTEPPHDYVTYLIPLPFAVFIFFWREFVKFFVRRSPNGWIAKIFST